MKNIKITRKITQGMYVLTTNDGGCIVDAVSQISSGDNPLVSVSVMKTNHTNKLLKNNNKFALSVLGIDANPEIIKTFGFNSSRDINKFENIETTTIDNINIIKNSLGYMLCEKVESIDNETHTLFIGKIIEADVYIDEEAMSYQYYQQNKEKILNLEASEDKNSWVCSICGYIHKESELPDDFQCPICGVGKEYFNKK